MNRAQVVALVDAAPAGLRTLRATLRRWVDPERAGEAIRRLSDPGAGGAAGGAVGVTSAIIRVGSIGPNGQPDDRSGVWFEAPGRWRLQAAGGDAGLLDVADGRRRWVGVPGDLVERAAGAAGPAGDFGPLGWLLAPGHLLGSYSFDGASDDTAGGRPCVRATAVERPGVDGVAPRPALSALAPGHPGLENRYWFDAEHGFVLRHEGSVDGRPSSVTELLDVHVDEPIDASCFGPPSGATVRTEWEALIARLQAMGVETAGIAPGDTDAARAAEARQYGPAALEDRVRHYVPTGPPPGDLVAAEAEVRRAFANVNEADGTGLDLVNVQAGQGLAPYVERAAHRLPRATRQNTRWEVDALRFVAPDEAVVWFTVVVDGLPAMIRQRAGRAVRSGGRWVVEHATVAELLAMANVRVPPPDER
jgi:hypothetical protein